MLNFHFFHRHPLASVSLKCQTLTKSRLAEISFMVFVLLRFPLYIIFYRTNVSKRDNSKNKKSNRTVFSVHFAKGDKTRPLCFQCIFICSVTFSNNLHTYSEKNDRKFSSESNKSYVLLRCLQSMKNWFYWKSMHVALYDKLTITKF